MEDKCDCVIVTRCKDCQFTRRRERGLYCIQRTDVKVEPEHYCSYGKKRSGVLIRVTKAPEEVFPEYWPDVGKVYEAEYVPGRKHSRGDNTGIKEFCVVNIRGKKIILRNGEFEVVGGAEDGKQTD